jgi:glycerate kinase
VRVVLAPNAFKGTIDAVEVATAWSEALAGRAEARMAPMSDGGDGFLAVVRHFRPDVLEVAARVRDPARRGITSRWGWDPEGSAAYLESAEAIGLRLVEPGLRDPLEATSAGLGRLIRTAAGLGPREIVVGLGGSATVDAGLGMARELGFRFEGRDGSAVERPADLPRLARIVPPEAPAVPETTRVLALADVTAPLHGPDGAARAFGPQKGADPAAVERLAEGLERMGAAWQADLGTPAELADRPGAGAAGGLGAALAAFLGARLVSGSVWCARLAGLEQALTGADGVVTGEGDFDRQSFRGKATGHVLALARAAGVRAAVVCAVAEAGIARGGPLVVDAAAIGRRAQDPLGREDLAQLVNVVLDRWESEPRVG